MFRHVTERCSGLSEAGRRTIGQALKNLDGDDMIRVRKRIATSQRFREANPRTPDKAALYNAAKRKVRKKAKALREGRAPDGTDAEAEESDISTSIDEQSLTSVEMSGLKPLPQIVHELANGCSPLGALGPLVEPYTNDTSMYFPQLVAKSERHEASDCR